MAFAQGSRTRLSIATQTDFDTTATTGFTALPFTTHSLNLSKERVVGNDIQSDRMPRHDRHGNAQAGGDIVADLRSGEFDVLLESAMFNTFSTNVLKVGTTPKYFTIEDYAADIDQAKLFTGMAVSSMGVSIAPNQMITTTFSMAGKNMTISATEQATVTASAGNSPFDSYSGDVKIADVDGISGATAACLLTAVDFTVNNSLSPTFTVGCLGAQSLEYGRAEVEGTLTAYFEDASLVNRFVNETETAIEVSVADPSGGSMTFLFPRVKINSADTSVDGPTSRFVNISFVALYDDTETSNLVITRA